MTSETKRIIDMNDYPTDDDIVTVEGEFDTYIEDGAITAPLRTQRFSI